MRWGRRGRPALPRGRAASAPAALGGKAASLSGNPRSPYGTLQEFPPGSPVAKVDAVLMDSSTVRAAEALAASLKNAGVPAYGRHTPGLATEQSRIKLSDGRLLW